MVDVVVVGGGMADLNNAIYVAKAENQAVVIEKQNRLGGSVKP
ncbi:NAD(P)-binding protein [Paenibacillus nanensis]|nr:NAD(P)-binding protein [Paenibacillus nanensis]